MTALIGTLGLAALAALVFALGGAAVCLLAAPRLLGRAAQRAPADRERVVFWLAVGPVVAGAALTALCFLPSLANLAGIGHDHCLHHDDAHLHFCFVHHPAMHGVVEPLALALFTVFAVFVALRELRARRRLASLTRQIGAASGVVVDVDVPVPFAATIGRLHPRILISRALRAALTPTQLAVVLAHEGAHVARRDLLRRWLVDVLSFVHWPSLRRRLVASHAFACEQACDEAAAHVTGDRLLVAETILAVERLLPADVAPVAAFADRGIEARVEALLASPQPSADTRWTTARTAFAAIVIVAAANPLHHATETLLGLITH